MTDKADERARFTPEGQHGLAEDTLKAWQRQLVVPPTIAEPFNPHDARHLYPCKDEAPLPEESGLMIDPGDVGGTGLE